MSLVRQCDCPDRCHEDERGSTLLAEIHEFEQWATFGGRDVCQWCLESCRYWRPRVIPEPSEWEKAMMQVYAKAIAAQLGALAKTEPPATTTGGS